MGMQGSGSAGSVAASEESESSWRLCAHYPTVLYWEGEAASGSKVVSPQTAFYSIRGRLRFP